MPPDLIRDPSADDPAVVHLRAALDAFYRSTQTYSAFEHTTDRSELYRSALAACGPRDRPIQILELGAGRSGLPQFLRDNGIAAEFDAQDVTPTNLDYLTPICRAVHVGDIADMQDRPYDLILSSYVFEHVSAPRQFLEHVDRLLRPGGVHVLVCPRYDVPGYLCPSLRNRGRWERLRLHLSLALSRLATVVDRRPRFWVNTRPSVLSMPWYRDADAVHLASRLDVGLWHRRRGYRVRPFRATSHGWKMWLLNAVLTIRVACHKPGGPT